MPSLRNVEPMQKTNIFHVWYLQFLEWFLVFCPTFCGWIFLFYLLQKKTKRKKAMIEKWDKFVPASHSLSFTHPNECVAYIFLYFPLPPVKSKILFISCTSSKKVEMRFVKHADKKEVSIAVIEFSRHRWAILKIRINTQGRSCQEFRRLFQRHKAISKNSNSVHQCP